MSTNSSSTSTPTSSTLQLSQDQAAKLSVAFNFAIIPCLSAVGICGNVLSMFLLARQRFRKSSNVLLFGLALADVLFLAGINNFSQFVLNENIPAGYKFSNIINYMFYVFFVLLLGAGYIGLYFSVLIPVLITADRLLVVFLPLSVHTIITPLRTLLALLCVGALIVACFIYEYVLCLRFEQVLLKGVLLGRFVPTERFYEDVRNGAYQLFGNILDYTTGVVPMILVTLGCVVIGLKVTSVARRRRQLTSGVGTPKNHPSSLVLSKSSRVLLKICCLYILCRSFGLLIVFLFKVPALQNEKALRYVLQLLNSFSQCINSVGNFVIYVAANNNFSYKDLATNCFPQNKGHKLKRRAVCL